MTRHILVAALITAVSAAGCGNGSDSAGEARTIRVGAVRISREEITLPVRTSGVLSSSSEQNLSFKTGGIISSINVDRGQMVSKGTVLAELDLAEITAIYLQAESAWKKAERDLRRMENLYSDSVVTLEQYENTRTSLDVARSSRDIAKFNLDHSTITAPQEGKVLQQFAEESEMTGPGSPVFLFGVTGDGWNVRVGVIDKDLVKIRKGDSASVKFDAWPGYSFPASVKEISGSADPMTGTFEVELDLDSGGRTLASGFAAKAEIFPSDGISSLLVPIESLVEADGERGFIFIVSETGDVARRVPVELDVLVGESVAVRGPIKAGMMVVTEGAPYLIDGSRIEVVR
jgi:RND family efflux transporter MFP subunit